MSEWTADILDERLVRAALVGTGKQVLPLQGEHPVDQFLLQRVDLSPEQQLLLQAGSRGIYRLAGTCAQPVPALPPASPESGIPVSPRLVTLLQGAFSPQSLPLLAEFLSILQAQGLQFPAALLPVALDCQDRTRRSQLQQVLGNRARWLAGFNPDWHWLLEQEESPADEPAWKQQFEEGAFSERVSALRKLRKRNAAAARELLQATITTEKGEQKRQLLECLREGLTIDDEPFLESFQRDRARKVRELVGELLSRMPGSRLSGRMCARVARCFHWDEEDSRSRGLHVTLPEKIPDDWEQDGLGADTAMESGSRSALIRELVGRTPLSFWLQHFQKSPAEFVAGTELNADGGAIRAGWAQALKTFQAPVPRREDWETALWTSGIRQMRRGNPETPELHTSFMTLVESTSARQLEIVLTELLQQSIDVLLMLPVEDWLARLTVPWSVELSQEYLRITRTLFRKQSDTAVMQWSATLLRAALGLSPECFDAALEPWSLNSSSGASWAASQVEALLHRFGEVIRLRREFREEACRCTAVLSEPSSDN